MNYEMLIERARYAAKSTLCMVEPRLLNRMADALENQEKVIDGLREIIEKQGGVSLRTTDLALELDSVKAELAFAKNQLMWAQAERDTVTKRMVQLEQELAVIKTGMPEKGIKE